MKTPLKIFLMACLSVSMSAAVADIVVVTSAKSSVGEMSKQQASDIFLGKTSVFPNGRAVVPLEQEEGAAARDEFHNKVTGKTRTQLKAYWSKQVFSGKGTPPKEFSNSTEIRKLVADNPNMVGYIDKNMVDDSVRVVVAP